MLYSWFQTMNKSLYRTLSAKNHGTEPVCDLYLAVCRGSVIWGGSAQESAAVELCHALYRRGSAISLRVSTVLELSSLPHLTILTAKPKCNLLKRGIQVGNPNLSSLTQTRQPKDNLSAQLNVSKSIKPDYFTLFMTKEHKVNQLSQNGSTMSYLVDKSASTRLTISRKRICSSCCLSNSSC